MFPSQVLLVHPPELGEDSVGQMVPQPPQLLLSFWTLTQLLPHIV
jgi:hypothetical protein